MTHIVKSPQIPSPNTTINSKNKNAKWQVFSALISLILIEVITFGINAKNIGIYQDEWITLSQLHFVPHFLPEIISNCFWNPRIIVRPIEALHFGPLFFLVKENPLWYHIVCYISEFFGAWFLYLALARLNQSKTTAFIAASLYLLYPIHDVTHYEIVASSLPISMAFYTASLWLYAKALDDDRFSLINLSAVAYFISLYNYELCLPFTVLYPVVYLYKKSKDIFAVDKNVFRDNIKTFIVFQIPSTLVTLSMLLYRRWLLPGLGLGYNYATVFSLSNFFSVLWAGWIVSFSPYTAQFSLFMLKQYLSEGFSVTSLLTLAIAVCSIFFYLFNQKCAEESNKLSSQTSPVFLILFGTFTIILSYTIYGLSPEHKPVIDAWLNRVNLGGALGASMIIAALFALLYNYTIGIPQHFKSVLFATLLAIFCGTLILINWQFAKPWMVSWKAQKELMTVIKSQAQTIKSGDSIIIGGIIRYASKWVPVVDGRWDFQGIVRTTLNNQKVNGTVVTERLTITKDNLVDKYGSIILGAFPYRQMILYDPSKNSWMRISSRDEFIKESKKLGWNIPESSIN